MRKTTAKHALLSPIFCSLVFFLVLFFAVLVRLLAFSFMRIEDKVDDE
jgi:hypothetical protein